MRRPRRPVSFVVALAYIGLACRGTGLPTAESCQDRVEPYGRSSKVMLDATFC